MREVTEINSAMIDSGDVFASVIAKMHEEGNGLLTAQIMTPSDAVQIVIRQMRGMPDEGGSLLLMEADKFLSTLDEHNPLCAIGNCDFPLRTHKDVGCMVVLHGATENPTTIIVAGVCETCWKEKFENDRDKALAGFMNYLTECLGPAAENMKVYNREQWEQRMAGNAPTTKSVN